MNGKAGQLPSYIEYPPDAAGVFAIWPDSGIPASSRSWTWHEQSMQIQRPGSATPVTMVRNVAIPTVTMFTPESPNGTSIVIAPGGSFLFLMMDHEGYDMARWLTTFGVTAFVLRYRLAHMPEEDSEMLAFMETLGQVLPVQNRGEERHRRWGIQRLRMPAVGARKMVCRRFASCVSMRANGDLIRCESELRGFRPVAVLR